MFGALPQLTELQERCLGFLFPQWCLGCGREGQLICVSCQRALSRIAPPVCPRCGKPQPSGILCPSCVSWQAAIDGIRAPFQFEGVIRKAIHQLKYQHLRALVKPLARMLGECQLGHSIPGDVLVPVPLHPRRLKERGYNQSALLAKELGKIAGLPVVEDCLLRSRPAPPQARAETVVARRNNVANAFVCRDRRLEGRRVILIDDVSTSGATLDACAKALKAAGVPSVWGLAIAKEI